MESKDWITLGMGIVTAVLVIIQLFYTIINAKKDRNIKAVTDQRSLWIKDVRKLFAQLINLFDLEIDNPIKIERHLSRDQRESLNYDSHIYELRKMYNELKLYLNFNNTPDLELIWEIENLICKIDLLIDYSFMIGCPDYNISEFVATKEYINLLMSMYLKAEWDRLKKESETGKTKSEYFQNSYDRLKVDNYARLTMLKEKAHKQTAKSLKSFLENNEQYKYYNIGVYSCLNITNLD